MGMAEYVPIVRHFRDLPNDPQSPAMRRMRRSIDPSNGTDWSVLLDKSPDEKNPIVLIAPTMTGKSTEMRQEARRRAARGELAIFAEATAIVDGVAENLGSDDSRVFDTWN